MPQPHLKMNLPYTIVLHGGAGTLLRSEITPEKETAYLTGLNEAAAIGFTILKEGGSATEAVKRTVMALEDNILFNAGKGAVFTAGGTQEMDAIIMNGSNLEAGAVAGVKNIRNPVALAEAVMLHSEHVLLSGTGANEFAIAQGFEHTPDDYFFSQYRYDQWQKIRASGATALDHSVHLTTEKKFGTVGAAACDQYGNLAAATSTGGMTNKNYGRIGDTPIIGAGNYANNKTCAISCTGHGEPFLRAVAAYDVSCLMEYKGFTLQQAMEEVTLKKLVAINGEGGMIGVDAQGNSALIFNSEGMYRAMKNSNGQSFAGIFR
jgi:L-asparaginase / beta-aspartyl-peptidase